MKKRKNRILSLLLTVCMVLTMLPTAAFATQTPDPNPAPGVEDTVPLTPLTPAEPTPTEETEEELPADVPVSRAAGDTVYVTQGGTGDGTFASPFGTLAAAYAAVTTNGEIRVLSDLDVAAATAFNGAKPVTIQSYDEATGLVVQTGADVHTLTRTKMDAELFTVDNAGGSVTMKNIILDGGNTVASKTLLHVLNGTVTLGEGVIIENHKITGQYLNIACATPNPTNTTTSLILDGAVIRNNTLDDGTGNAGNPNGILGAGSGGKVIINDCDITGNTLLNTSVVVGIGSSGKPSFTMSGGKIENNTLASGVAAVYMRGTAADAAFNFSGAPVVYDNKNGSGEQRNVYLNNTAAIGTAYLNLTGALTSGAKIGVYALTMPTSNAKLVDVAIGTGGYTAQQSDANCFFSDKATGAGIVFDTNKVVLDYDARVVVNTDVALDASGKASITIDPTTEGAFYAVLDKTGAVVAPNVTVTGGTSVAGTNWYTAGTNGKMTFAGLDPANGPYQVVTSGSSATPPATNSGSLTNGTAVGGKVQFLYVAGVAGTDFAQGSDSADGTRATPKLTLTGAYTAADKAAGTTNVVIVLTPLAAEPALNVVADVTIIITSETTTPQTITRSAGGALITIDSANVNLTLKNIILDGNKNANIAGSGPLVLVKQGCVVLDSGATLQNNKNDGTSTAADFGGGMLVTKNTAGTQQGTATMKTGAKITGNSASWGGGVHVNYKASFTIEGGEISGNAAVKNSGATNGGGFGGGLSGYSTGTTTTIGGGVIKNNTAEAYGGGFYAADGVGINLSGDPVIIGNTVGGAANNLYLDNSKTNKQTITITAPHMENDANVGVYVSDMPDAAGEKVTIATDAEQADAKYFHSDKMTQAGIAFDAVANTIILSYDARAKATGKVDKDGKGEMIVEVQEGTKYQVTDTANKPVPGITATDASGTTLLPDENGWYTTNNGPLVFKPLELAKEYEVHNSTEANPGAPTPGGGSVVKIPVVGDNVYAKPEDGDTVTIVIDPADPKIKYAVLDDAGNQVYPKPDGTWVPGNNDKIVVELPGLPAGEEYTIVGVPIGDTTSTPAGSTDGGGKVTAPAGGLTDVAPGSVSRLPDTDHAGKDKIIINPTKNGQDYGVYNPITGKTEWKPADGGALEFHPLDPDVDYQVVTRTTDADGATEGKQPSLPTQGINVPAATITPGMDAQGGATLTIDPSKAGIEYAIKDATGAIVSGWVDGTGEILTVTTNKPYVAPLQVVSRPDGNTGHGTNLGGAEQFFYVKSDGVDGPSADGSKAKPYATIPYAVGKLPAGKLGVAVVLSNLTHAASYNSAATNGKTALITSDMGEAGAPFTVSHSGSTSSLWHLPDDSQDNVTLQHIIMDGKGHTNGNYGEFFIGDGSTLILGQGATLQSFTPRAINIRAGGTVVMLPGSTIKDCTAGKNVKYSGDNYDGTENAGGGIYLCPNGTLDLRGGSITGNTATHGAAGVFGEAGSVLKLSGSPIVDGNTNMGAASNLYLNAGQTIQITGPVTSGMGKIGVYVQDMPTDANKEVVVATGVGHTITATEAKAFFSDKETEAGILLKNNTIVLSYDARTSIGAGVNPKGEGFITIEPEPDTDYAIKVGEPAVAQKDLTVIDKDGNVVPNQPNPDTGWITFPEGKGPFTVKPLPKGEDVSIVTKPTNTTGDPGPLDPVGTVTIPGVGGDVTGEIIQPDKAIIVIQPSDPDLIYIVTDSEGNVIDSGAGNGGKLTLPKAPKPLLDPDKGYIVTTTPNSDPAPEIPNKINPNTKPYGPSIPVTMPGPSIQPIDPGTIGRVDGLPEGKDKITIPSVVGQEYAIVDPDTGEVIAPIGGDGDGWLPGTGGELTFQPLEPGKDYQVVTRTPGEPGTPGTPGDPNDPGNPGTPGTPPKEPSIPLPGITVPGTTVKPDEVKPGVTEAGKNAIILPAPTNPDTKYAIVDPDTGKVVAPLAGGDKDGWLTGDPNGPLVFAPATPGKDYVVVTMPKDPTDTDPVNGGNESGTPYPKEPTPVGPSITVPTVTEDQLTGTIDPGNPGGVPAVPATATITVKPSDIDLIYAVVDASGNVVGGADGWQQGTGKDGAALEFTGLTPNADYKVVSLPKDTAKPWPAQITDPDHGTAIKTPMDPGKAPISTMEPDRKPITDPADPNKGKDKVTVPDPGEGFEIAVIDPVTGEIIEGGQWQPGGDGDLTFQPLDPEKGYEVVVRPTQPEDGIRVPTRPGITVPKVGAMSVTGIVKDAAGAPVAGAEVKVTVATLDGGYKTISVKTDAEGKYEIKGDHIQLPGEYAIYVSSDKGCQTSVQKLKQAQPQTLADIITDATTTNIVGGAASQNGKPIKDATVVIRDKNTGAALAPQPDGHLTTTPGGGYVVEGLVDGTYIFETSGTDANGNPISGMTEVKVENGKIVPNVDGGYKNTNLNVTPGSIVSGKVEGLKPGETANVTITVPVYDENGAIIGTKNVTAQAVGETGYYQFAGVPNGDYPISVVGPDGKTVVDEVTVSGATVKDITLPGAKPQNPGVVSGIVMDEDGKPVKDAVVTIYDKDGNVVTPTKPATITTGKGGGWSVEGLDPAKGPYHASVDKDGTNGIAGPFTVAADGKVTGKTNIELDGTVDTATGVVDGTDGKLLSGKVTDSKGAPAAGATVVVKDNDGKVIATTTTNASGEYFVGNVPANATVSVVTKNGETGKPANLGTGATLNGDTTTAPADANILTVISPDGGTLPVGKGDADKDTAKVTVTGKAPTANPADGQILITDGKLDVSKLPSGTYVVTVEQGGMSVEKEITVSNTAPGNSTGVITGDKTLTIPPHKVEGKLDYATGTIPSDATVTITGTEPVKNWGTAAVNPSTGKFDIPGVPEGEYKVTVTVKDPTDPDKTVTIDTTLTVDKNGNVSYGAPWTASPVTGGTITTKPDGSLSVLTKAPSDAVQVIIDAINSAIAGADNLDAVTGAMDKFNNDLTDEEKKQVDKAKVEELSTKLETLLGKLKFNTEAEGVNNTDAAKAALNEQRGLLAGGKAITDAATKNVDIDLALKAENITDNPPTDKNKVEAAARGGEIGAYFDITITKTTTVKEVGADETSATITTEKVTSVPLSIPITLPIPADMQGHQFYNVIRVHEGVAKRIPSTATTNGVTFSSNLYSTYALIASDTPIFGDEIAVTPDAPSTGGGAGGSSSSSATVKKPNGGTVAITPKNPKPGDKVTITVTPDEGFTTDKVVVKTTPGGKELELTDNGDGTYTYTQPKERVVIDATFKKVTGDPDSNGVSDLLNTVDHMAYLKGNDAGNFAPTADMTRAEVAQMFYNLLKNKDTNLGNKASFSDVNAEAWYATAVNTLANIGILNGVGDGNFAPARTITRAEFVAIATRFAAKTTGSKTYTDVAADHWANQAIGAASYYGWIDGYDDGTFKPTANIARSEAVKVVNAMLGRSADKAFIDKAEDLKTFPDVPKTDWAYYEIAEATNDHDYAKKDDVESWTK